MTVSARHSTIGPGAQDHDASAAAARGGDGAAPADTPHDCGAVGTRGCRLVTRRPGRWLRAPLPPRPRRPARMRAVPGGGGWAGCGRRRALRRVPRGSAVAAWPALPAMRAAVALRRALPGGPDGVLRRVGADRLRRSGAGTGPRAQGAWGAAGGGPDGGAHRRHGAARVAGGRGRRARPGRSVAAAAAGSGPRAPAGRRACRAGRRAVCTAAAAPCRRGGAGRRGGGGPRPGAGGGGGGGAGAPRRAGGGRRAGWGDGGIGVGLPRRAARPRVVVLVDDVHPPGATLHACARALRTAGSCEVRALTWARTLPFSRAVSTLGRAPDPSPQEGRMQIEVKGRNTPVSEDVREHVEKRFAKVGKQVSELAVLAVELWEERNPANPDSQVAEVTLHLQGTVLRARDASRDMVHSINLCADELARQVKRDRDKRRRRREARSPGVDGPSTAPGDVSPAL